MIKKLTVLSLVFCITVLFTACSTTRKPFVPSSIVADNLTPIDESTLNETQRFYVDIAKFMYLAGFEINGTLTEKQKADAFMLLVNIKGLYTDKSKQWWNEQNKCYYIPLADIEEILFTHLPINDFSPYGGFELLRMTQFCDIPLGYDENNKMYVTKSLGGYGGVRFFKLLLVEQKDKETAVTLGVYDERKTELFEKYTVRFGNTTDDMKNFMILGTKTEICIFNTMPPGAASDAEQLKKQKYLEKYVRPLVMSSITWQSWNSPDEIPADKLFQFANLTIDEKKYWNKDKNLFIIPYNAINDRVTKRFNIKNDYLKTHKSYNEKTNTFDTVLGYGGAAEVAISNIDETDHSIGINFIYYDSYYNPVKILSYVSLNIAKEKGGYKYASCVVTQP